VRGERLFSSLDKKMKMILQVVILIYVLLSSIFVFQTIENRNIELQHQLSLQYTGQQHKNAQLFMIWMEEMASIVTNNRHVQNALSRTDHDQTITPILDGMGSSNLYILDMVLYGEQGSVYASSRVSGLRSYEEIKKIPEYAQFLASDASSKWVIMESDSLVYRQSDPRRRLIYLEKIQDDSNQNIGILAMDVDLNKMSSFYLFNDSDSYRHSTSALLTHDRILIDSSGRTVQLDAALTTALQNEQSSEDVKVIDYEDGSIFLYRMHQSDEQIVIIISNDPIYTELKFLRNVIIIGAISILVLFYILIQRLSTSIFDPLKQLHRNMRRHYNK